MRKQYQPLLLLVFALLALFMSACARPGSVVSQSNYHYLASYSAEKPLPPGTCILRVPSRPLSLEGLTTPWQLSECKEDDPNASVFVQGMVFDPATGALSVYSPLVITAGTKPAAAPVPPTLPADAVVALWGGGNDNSTILRGPGADTCWSNNVQVFFCGTADFFNAVNASSKVMRPTPGTAVDGQPCPTTRDFAVVDQDQSDNVQTHYLALPDGQTAQDTAANRAQFPGATVLSNGSDNALLSAHLDPALGCTPWTVPDLADPGSMVAAQALNELQAAAYQAAPQADVPLGDPMVMVDGKKSLRETNSYRVNVDQPFAFTTAQASTKTYCQRIVKTAPARLLLDKALLLGQPSPVPTLGNNLYTFMAARLSATLSGPVGVGLGCTSLYHLKNPVELTLDGNGVAIAATINGE